MISDDEKESYQAKCSLKWPNDTKKDSFILINEFEQESHERFFKFLENIAVVIDKIRKCCLRINLMTSLQKEVAHKSVISEVL